MNPLQMSQQIKDVLATLQWPASPGGTEDVVFGSRAVFVFAGTPTDEQIPAGFPWALVGIDSGVPDEDHPGRMECSFSVLIAAEVAGDPLGEFALIGGAAADLGKSVGRGVLEVTTVARTAIEDMVGTDGAQIMVTSQSVGAPALLGNGRHIAVAEIGVKALLTSDLHYAAPQVVEVAGSTWTWEGSQCSSRFDFLQYRLVWKTGTTPPANPLDGTTAYTGTAATATEAATAGRVFAVFADYNGRGGSGVEGSSSPIVGSYVAT